MGATGKAHLLFTTRRIMNVNTVQEEVQQKEVQQPSFRPVIVDLEELKRVERNFQSKIASRFYTNTQCVFFDSPGKHPYKTIVAFIKSGHSALDIKGLTKLLKEQDYTIRLEGLQVLEAYVEILVNRSGEFAEVRNLHEITEAMIARKRAFIQEVKQY